MATQKYEQPGPWDNEPDELDWTDEATGYKCCVLRVPGSGHLCGYVCIPEGHPLHGVSYSAEITKKPSRHLFGEWFLIEHDYDTAGGLFSVHGGVTFSEDLNGREGFWYGFDCAHCDDLSPEYAFRYRDMPPRGVYRDLDYVKAECASLAKQIQQVAA